MLQRLESLERFAPADDTPAPPQASSFNSPNRTVPVAHSLSDGADSGKENSQSSSSEKQPGAQAEWSCSLKAYVSRCFAQCRTDVDKDVMERKLRERLTSAFEQGQDNTNWDAEPLPLIPSNSVSFAAAESGPMLQSSPSAARGAVFGRGNRMGLAFGSGRGSRGRFGNSAFGRSKSRSRSRSPYSRGKYERSRRRDR